MKVFISMCFTPIPADIFNLYLLGKYLLLRGYDRSEKSIKIKSKQNNIILIAETCFYPTDIFIFSNTIAMVNTTYAIDSPAAINRIILLFGIFYWRCEMISQYIRIIEVVLIVGLIFSFLHPTYRNF